MPRNEEVLPSRRPRSLPPLIWTTGGFRFGPVAAAADGLGASCDNGFPATPTTAPPIKAVAVPSSSRRFSSCAMVRPPMVAASRVAAVFVTDFMALMQSARVRQPSTEDHVIRSLAPQRDVRIDERGFHRRPA